MKSNVGLSDSSVEVTVARLVPLVADINQLLIKNLGYHWNVEDPRFQSLHNLFEEGYDELFADLDVVAERIRMLGKRAPQSLKELASASRLGDTKEAKSSDEMLEFLAQDYESLLVWIREDIESAEKQGDPGTADMLTALLRQYEKRAWFLRSHLNLR